MNVQIIIPVSKVTQRGIYAEQTTDHNVRLAEGDVTLCPIGTYRGSVTFALSDLLEAVAFLKEHQ